MLCGGHRLENLALRHQLAVYKKMVNSCLCRARSVAATIPIALSEWNERGLSGMEVLAKDRR